ncbi:MAG: sugar nucleotide-binding protein [Chitinivibrionales bacterium]|nr:sugar nucleotide-binding protein [Chitinivibrionales bacterium]
MHILLTGASGLLGRAILKELKNAAEFSVVGTAFSRAKGDLYKVDLTDPPALQSCLADVNPDFIVHAAAERHPDTCRNDPDGTQLLNVEVTRRIAQWCAACSRSMLYLSTDYVFDGVNPPYAPGDAPHPLNVYGKSKLEGEENVKDLAPESLILRVPVLYGHVETLDESPVTKLARRVMTRRQLTYDNWAQRYPTHVADVASVIRQILFRRAHGDMRGVYHWAHAEAYTKFGMAQSIARILGVDLDLVLPDNNPAPGAPRPQNSQLDCSDLLSSGIRADTLFEAGIASAIKPFV